MLKFFILLFLNVFKLKFLNQIFKILFYVFYPIKSLKVLITDKIKNITNKLIIL